MFNETSGYKNWLNQITYVNWCTANNKFRLMRLHILNDSSNQQNICKEKTEQKRIEKNLHFDTNILKKEYTFNILKTGMYIYIIINKWTSFLNRNI